MNEGGELPSEPRSRATSPRSTTTTSLSTRAYLGLLARDRLAQTGLLGILLGMLLVNVSTPEAGTTLALLGGLSLLGGAVVFAAGYTRVQHRLRDRRSDAS